ncbi:MAG: Rrf2 family transcriptional regulator [Elusimicrobiota bacterium]
MKISSAEEYGLRCLLQLASAKGAYLGISAIAKAEGLTQAYTGKLMFMLKRGGIVKSTRGAHGGYNLAFSPEKVSMDRIMRALTHMPRKEQEICTQFPGEESRCVHSRSACGLRTVWFKIYKDIWGVLENTTLADLLKDGALQEAKLSLAKEKKDAVA